MGASLLIITKLLLARQTHTLKDELEPTAFGNECNTISSQSTVTLQAILKAFKKCVLV